jgi:hypothetical protein
MKVWRSYGNFSKGRKLIFDYSPARWVSVK